MATNQQSKNNFAGIVLRDHSIQKLSRVARISKGGQAGGKGVKV